MVVLDRLSWQGGPSVSFEVADRERVYVCSAGGTEAAALLLAVAGFARARGRVLCDGRDVSAVPTPQRHIAYVPAGRAEPRDAVLARALAVHPAALLVDEGVDEAAILPRALERLPVPSTLVATGVPGVALARAERIVLLDRGVVQIGTPADLYERPASMFAARFFGACSLLPWEGGWLVLRPHQVRLATDGVSGRVVRLDYFGAATRVVLDVAGTEVLMDVERPTVAVGQAVRVAWDAAWHIPG